VVKGSYEKTAMPRPFQLYELAGGKPRCLSPVLADCKTISMTGDAPICFPYQPGGIPRRRDGTAVRGLPRAVGYPSLLGHGSREVDGDATWFADGTPLVIWDGSPYLAKGAGFRRLAKAGLRPDESSSSVPIDDDHVLTMRSRRLFTVSRAGKVARRFPGAENVRALYPGPDGAILLHQGDNDDDHAAKLWWPATKEYVGITARELGADDVRWVGWARKPKMLVALDDRDRFLALEGVEARPRKPER
jgi:hypothetical protein